ncbi:GGDEF domain-containing protein [Rhodoferax sp.]|uniref:GGDEF domain-containing protein n=1 Tax=Rhodoferax sp. TaxID=50421 RepID=UPI0025D83C45|nr:GGDEF domain-containing protein [Rhodoferax sp.]
MNALVQSLATLGGLRDRDALDAEIVRLLVNSSGIDVLSVNLIRVVGEGDERRCLSLGALQSGQNQMTRDLLWSDWSQLPRVSDFPLRQKALEKGRATLSPNGERSVVLPMLNTNGLQILLDIDARYTLAPDAIDLLQSILLAYQNLLGLLDYGERDSLTELLNRKTFDGAFFKATADKSSSPPDSMPDRRHESSEAGVWLAVLDIDHFKRVNDNFGHLIGDEVLLLLARLMRGNFRFHDQLYRFGGEEFVILMRCDCPEHAEGALERLRLRVQEYAFPQVGTITVSMGVSTLLPNDTPSSAFGRADKAVYYAKEHGRNQVCNYQTLVSEGKLVEQQADEMDVDLF